ncbi:Zn-dependent hydrolase [Castellaniella sp.]|uniref:Zn-dependent hydrolase n=1 Tax=Castellaniella sp. TaxID=1955812 RepID=UPI00356405DC
MTRNMTLTIDGDRLWQSLMDLARIGPTAKGGSCRLALTDLDTRGRDLVTGWMKEAGLDIRVDQIGNIIGRRAGQDPDLKPVAMGSHIDTQPTGGRFDGCYGVMAGLEVMRTLNDQGVQTRAPLELMIWTNEEGARFAPAMMGSGVFCGAIALESALETVGRDGKKVRDELARSGYAGSIPVPGVLPDSYFEAHIEQGPVLEDENQVIGVVTGSLALRWYDVTVTGSEAHAGPTPMHLRHDALFAATHLMQAVVHIARAHAPEGRGTVGIVEVRPGSPNVIPGTVRFTVDLRHEDPARLGEMDAELKRVCEQLPDTVGYPVQVSLAETWNFPATPFDAGLVGLVRAQAQARGYSHRDIVTGAGHDAVYMATVVPTAMVFVPCRDGISHNEAEYAEPAHLEAGANVLLGAVLERAGACGLP